MEIQEDSSVDEILGDNPRKFIAEKIKQRRVNFLLSQNPQNDFQNRNGKGRVTVLNRALDQNKQAVESKEFYYQYEQTIYSLGSLFRKFSIRKEQVLPDDDRISSNALDLQYKIQSPKSRSTKLLTTGLKSQFSDGSFEDVHKSIEECPQLPPMKTKRIIF